MSNPVATTCPAAGIHHKESCPTWEALAQCPIMSTYFRWVRCANIATSLNATSYLNEYGSYKPKDTQAFMNTAATRILSLQLMVQAGRAHTM